MTDQSNTIEPEILKRYTPFDLVDDKLLEMLAHDIEVKTAMQGFSLFECGEEDQEEYFLIKGQVKLVADDGRENLIEAGEEKSRYPLAHLRPRKYCATAATTIEYFIVDASVLGELHQSADRGDHEYGVREMKQKAGEEGRALLYEFKQELNNGRFILPSLPEVALRIRELIDRQESNAAEIAKLVNTDPAIAAKLIKVANSAFYRGAAKCDNTSSAITRLGLITTKQLVTSFAVLGLFKTTSHMFKDYMRKLWTNSIEVAANSFVLAKHLKNFEPEEALLAGLLHCIGEITVVSYAERYYELATEEMRLALIIKCLRGEVGALVLEAWGFPEELVTVARESDNWLRESSQEIDLCDLVQVAILHAMMGDSTPTALPAVPSVPAFRKLAQQQLSPEMSIQIIHEARDQIAELKQLISS